MTVPTPSTPPSSPSTPSSSGSGSSYSPAAPYDYVQQIQQQQQQRDFQQQSYRASTYEQQQWADKWYQPSRQQQQPEHQAEPAVPYHTVRQLDYVEPETGRRVAKEIPTPVNTMSWFETWLKGSITPEQSRQIKPSEWQKIHEYKDIPTTPTSPTALLRKAAGEGVADIFAPKTVPTGGYGISAERRAEMIAASRKEAAFGGSSIQVKTESGELVSVQTAKYDEELAKLYDQGKLVEGKTYGLYKGGGTREVGVIGEKGETVLASDKIHGASAQQYEGAYLYGEKKVTVAPYDFTTKEIVPRELPKPTLPAYGAPVPGDTYNVYVEVGENKYLKMPASQAEDYLKVAKDFGVVAPDKEYTFITGSKKPVGTFAFESTKLVPTETGEYKYVPQEGGIPVLDIDYISTSGQEVYAPTYGVSPEAIAASIVPGEGSPYTKFIVKEGYYYGVTSEGKEVKMNVAESGVLPDPFTYLFVPYGESKQARVRVEFLEEDVKKLVAEGKLSKEQRYDIFDIGGKDVGDILPEVSATYSPSAPRIQMIDEILYGSSGLPPWLRDELWTGGGGTLLTTGGDVSYDPFYMGSGYGYAVFVPEEGTFAGGAASPDLVGKVLIYKYDFSGDRYESEKRLYEAGDFDLPEAWKGDKTLVGEVTMKYSDWISHAWKSPGESSKLVELSPGKEWGIKLFSETGQERFVGAAWVSPTELASAITLPEDIGYKSIEVEGGYYYGVTPEGKKERLNVAETGVLPDITSHAAGLVGTYTPPSGSPFTKYEVMGGYYYGVTGAGEKTRLNQVLPGSSPDTKYIGYDIEDWSKIPDEWKSNVGGYAAYQESMQQVIQLRYDSDKQYWQSLQQYNPLDVVKVYDKEGGTFMGTAYRGEIWAPGTFTWQAKFDTKSGTALPFASGVKTLDQMGVKAGSAPPGTVFYDPTDSKHPFKTVYAYEEDGKTKTFVYTPTDVALFGAIATGPNPFTATEKDYEARATWIESFVNVRPTTLKLEGEWMESVAKAREVSIREENLRAELVQSQQKDIENIIAGQPWVSYQHIGLSGETPVIQGGIPVAIMGEHGIEYIKPSPDERFGTQWFTTESPISKSPVLGGGKLFEEVIFKTTEPSKEITPELVGGVPLHLVSVSVYPTKEKAPGTQTPQTMEFFYGSGATLVSSAFGTKLFPASAGGEIIHEEIAMLPKVSTLPQTSTQTTSWVDVFQQREAARVGMETALQDPSFKAFSDWWTKNEAIGTKYVSETDQMREMYETYGAGGWWTSEESSQYTAALKLYEFKWKNINIPELTTSGKEALKQYEGYSTEYKKFDEQLSAMSLPSGTGTWYEPIEKQWGSFASWWGDTLTPTVKSTPFIGESLVKFPGAILSAYTTYQSVNRAVLGKIFEPATVERGFTQFESGIYNIFPEFPFKSDLAKHFSSDFVYTNVKSTALWLVGKDNQDINQYYTKTLFDWTKHVTENPVEAFHGAGVSIEQGIPKIQDFVRPIVQYSFISVPRFLPGVNEIPGVKAIDSALGMGTNAAVWATGKTAKLVPGAFEFTFQILQAPTTYQGVESVIKEPLSPIIGEGGAEGIATSARVMTDIGRGAVTWTALGLASMAYLPTGIEFFARTPRKFGEMAGHGMAIMGGQFVESLKTDPWATVGGVGSMLLADKLVQTLPIKPSVGRVAARIEIEPKLRPGAVLGDIGIGETGLGVSGARSFKPGDLISVPKYVNTPKWFGMWGEVIKKPASIFTFSIDYQNPWLGLKKAAGFEPIWAGYEKVLVDGKLVSQGWKGAESLFGVGVEYPAVRYISSKVLPQEWLRIAKEASWYPLKRELLFKKYKGELTPENRAAYQALYDMQKTVKEMPRQLIDISEPTFATNKGLRTSEGVDLIVDNAALVNAIRENQLIIYGSSLHQMFFEGRWEQLGLSRAEIIHRLEKDIEVMPASGTDRAAAAAALELLKTFEPKTARLEHITDTPYPSYEIYNRLLFEEPKKPGGAREPVGAAGIHFGEYPFAVLRQAETGRYVVLFDPNHPMYAGQMKLFGAEQVRWDTKFQKLKGGDSPIVSTPQSARDIIITEQGTLAESPMAQWVRKIDSMAKHGIEVDPNTGRWLIRDSAGNIIRDASGAPIDASDIAGLKLSPEDVHLRASGEFGPRIEMRAKDLFDIGTYVEHYTSVARERGFTKWADTIQSQWETILENPRFRESYTKIYGEMQAEWATTKQVGQYFENVFGKPERTQWNFLSEVIGETKVKVTSIPEFHYFGPSVEFGRPSPALSGARRMVVPISTETTFTPFAAKMGDVVGVKLGYREPAFLDVSVIYEGYVPSFMDSRMAIPRMQEYIFRSKKPYAIEAFNLNLEYMRHLVSTHPRPPQVHDPYKVIEDLQRIKPGTGREFLDLLKEYKASGGKKFKIGGSFSEMVQSAGGFKPLGKDIDIWAVDPEGLSKFMAERYYTKHYGKENVVVEKGGGIELKLEGEWKHGMDVKQHPGDSIFDSIFGKQRFAYGIEEAKPIKVKGLDFVPFQELQLRRAVSTGTLHKSVKGEWYAAPAIHRGKDIADVMLGIRSEQAMLKHTKSILGTYKVENLEHFYTGYSKMFEKGFLPENQRLAGVSRLREAKPVPFESTGISRVPFTTRYTDYASIKKLPSSLREFTNRVITGGGRIDPETAMLFPKKSTPPEKSRFFTEDEMREILSDEKRISGIEEVEEFMDIPGNKPGSKFDYKLIEESALDRLLSQRERRLYYKNFPGSKENIAATYIDPITGKKLDMGLRAAKRDSANLVFDENVISKFLDARGVVDTGATYYRIGLDDVRVAHTHPLTKGDVVAGFGYPYELPMPPSIIDLVGQYEIGNRVERIISGRQYIFDIIRSGEFPEITPVGLVIKMFPRHVKNTMLYFADYISGGLIQYPTTIAASPKTGLVFEAVIDPYGKAMFDTLVHLAERGKIEFTVYEIEKSYQRTLSHKTPEEFSPDISADLNTLFVEPQTPTHAPSIFGRVIDKLIGGYKAGEKKFVKFGEWAGLSEEGLLLPGGKKSTIYEIKPSEFPLKKYLEQPTRLFEPMEPGSLRYIDIDIHTGEVAGRKAVVLKGEPAPTPTFKYDLTPPDFGVLRLEDPIGNKMPLKETALIEYKPLFPATLDTFNLPPPQKVKAIRAAVYEYATDSRVYTKLMIGGDEAKAMQLRMPDFTRELMGDIDKIYMAFEPMKTPTTVYRGLQLREARDALAKIIEGSFEEYQRGSFLSFSKRVIKAENFADVASVPDTRIDAGIYKRIVLKTTLVPGDFALDRIVGPHVSEAEVILPPTQFKVKSISQVEMKFDFDVDDYVYFPSDASRADTYLVEISPVKGIGKLPVNIREVYTSVDAGIIKLPKSPEKHAAQSIIPYEYKELYQSGGLLDVKYLPEIYPLLKSSTGKQSITKYSMREPKYDIFEKTFDYEYISKEYPSIGKYLTMSGRYVSSPYKMSVYPKEYPTAKYPIGSYTLDLYPITKYQLGAYTAPGYLQGKYPSPTKYSTIYSQKYSTGYNLKYLFGYSFGYTGIGKYPGGYPTPGKYPRGYNFGYPHGGKYPQGQPRYPPGQPTYPPGQPTYPPGHPGYPPPGRSEYPPPEQYRWREWWEWTPRTPPPPPWTWIRRKREKEEWWWPKFKKQQYFLYKEYTPTWTPKQMATQFPMRVASSQYRKAFGEPVRMNRDMFDKFVGLPKRASSRKRRKR